MKLYYAPISTYSQKVLLAFYEKGIEFESSHVNLFSEESRAEYRDIYPLGKIPLLINGDDVVPESSCIIDYLDLHSPETPRMVPVEAEKARQVRLYDRMNDFYLNDPVVTLILTPADTASQEKQQALQKARDTLQLSYSHIDQHLSDGREFMSSEAFSLADCSAIPALYYAQQAQPFEEYEHIRDYYQRMSQRSSYQMVLAEAEPILAKLFG